MRDNTTSVDGFIPRRQGSESEPLRGALTSETASPIRPVEMQDKATKASSLTRTNAGLKRSDIDESLREIDDSPVESSRKQRRRDRKEKKPRSRRFKIVRWIIILLVVAVLAVAGWFAYKLIHASGNIFSGDIFGLTQQKELQMDSNGRSNILILGTSEDDPGHEGANLTDSIMVLSIDQKNKNAYMISIPRDLEAQYGRACLSGYSGKVNVYFSCVNDDMTSKSAETDRQTASRKFFGDIVGLDIQYSVHVNYTVMRDIVKALDGITVTIESRDPNGQMDGNFDWKCGATYSIRKINCPPNGHFIDYPNGPVNLDAEHALYLAQARGDTDVQYGFDQSNFDREKNQQKIMVAIRDKAMSTGTLTDLGKVTGIIDALGNNLRTNFDTSEIRTLMSLAKDIPSASIQSISMIDNGLVNGKAQPTAGMYNFTAIQAFIKKQISSDPVMKEAAKVVVLNGSGVSGLAKSESTALETMGMTIGAVDTYSGDASAANTVYQISKTKTATKSRLESRYGTTALTTTPPIAVDSDVDFVIIVGSSMSKQ